MTIVRAGRRLVRVGVTNSMGLLPLFEFKLKATRWRAARRLKRREDAEVAGLRQRFAPLPWADVATIIPTHRRPEPLLAAIDSALSQTVDDHRVLVVSDGRDPLPTLPLDPRLSVVQLSGNIGVVGVVRNIGIRLTQSRLIAFLDDDNTWQPEHLERAIEAHRSGADLAYSSMSRVDASGALLDVLGEPFNRRTMRERSLVDTNTIVVRRGTDVIFSRIPRRRHDFPLEDWELVWRLSRRLSIQHVPDVTVRYVLHPGSHYSDWGTDA